MCLVSRLLPDLSLIKQHIYDTMHTQREQLMEDIDVIVDEFTFNLPIEDIYKRSELAEELTSVLCDAVCKNFPN